MRSILPMARAMRSRSSSGVAGAGANRATTLAHCDGSRATVVRSLQPWPWQTGRLPGVAPVVSILPTLEPPGSLPVSEKVPSRTFSVPWFKKYYPNVIEEYALAFRKAAENHRELLKDDPGNPPSLGGWHFFAHR